MKKGEFIKVNQQVYSQILAAKPNLFCKRKIWEINRILSVNFNCMFIKIFYALKTRIRHDA